MKITSKNSYYKKCRLACNVAASEINMIHIPHSLGKTLRDQLLISAINHFIDTITLYKWKQDFRVFYREGDNCQGSTASI